MERFYRVSFHANDLVYYNIKWLQSDIYVGTETDLTEICLKTLKAIRLTTDRYIAERPAFETSLIPLEIAENAPELIKMMGAAGKLTGTGPMAAVAGAFNEMLYRAIKDKSENIILENGGDLLIAGDKPRRVGIYGGENKLKDRLYIEIDPEGGAAGVCTSSGTLGHSLSFGKADSATIISNDSALADAAATATANIVKTEKDITSALDFAMSINGVDGAIITINDKLGACGKVKFV